ncbi:hypothetical protein GSI_01093 [Ganoderma sinense ZZ0214-1]|uniref:Peptidase S54 rhomboid domain-containing protein n=1 Tax=Ganoderma sinense ZZ0214-1 TaxID=1077348 RepID=A0A2G8SUE4_9APHY|nr:hypothetical protein GSI_01093 [Ganoderma sinense ZZ0214-1]
MSFEYAAVTKSLMFGIALTSAVAGIFDLKHYLNLQLVPHISKHHQYWRLFVHHLACASSSDLLLTELLLYNVGIPIERAFGGVKYASFFIISAVTTMVVSFVALLLAQLIPMTRANFNNIPGGPFAILFAIIYQYMRLVPPAYHFRVFGLGMSDKIWIYAIAFQLTVARLPATLLPTAVGLFVGYMYRSDVLQLKSWRLPPRLVRLAEDWVKPLLGEDKPVRRTHRVLPEPRAPGSARGSRRAVNLADDEVVTTARSAPRRRVPRPSSGTPSTIDVDANTNAAAETLPAGENGSEQARDRADTGAPASAIDTGSGMNPLRDAWDEIAEFRGPTFG